MIDLETLAAKLKIGTDIDVRESRNLRDGSIDYLYCRIPNPYVAGNVSSLVIYADGTAKLTSCPVILDDAWMDRAVLVRSLITDCAVTK